MAEINDNTKLKDEYESDEYASLDIFKYLLKKDYFKDFKDFLKCILKEKIFIGNVLSKEDKKLSNLVADYFKNINNECNKKNIADYLIKSFSNGITDNTNNINSQILANLLYFNYDYEDLTRKASKYDEYYSKKNIAEKNLIKDYNSNKTNYNDIINHQSDILTTFIKIFEDYINFKIELIFTGQFTIIDYLCNSSHFIKKTADPSTKLTRDSTALDVVKYIIREKYKPSDDINRAVFLASEAAANIINITKKASTLLTKKEIRVLVNTVDNELINANMQARIVNDKITELKLLIAGNIKLDRYLYRDENRIAIANKCVEIANKEALKIKLIEAKMESANLIPTTAPPAPKATPSPPAASTATVTKPASTAPTSINNPYQTEGKVVETKISNSSEITIDELSYFVNYVILK